MEWMEFCQSKEVWNTLRRRPKAGDYIKYTKGQLNVVGDADGKD